MPQRRKPSIADVPLAGAEVPQSNPIAEAWRYYQNAQDILATKAGKEGSYYSDPKYVRMAGNTAWNGVLIALDAVLKITDNLKRGQRADIKDYQAAVGKRDNKLSKQLTSAYNLMHKSMGYDGELNANLVKTAMEEGRKVIEWCQRNYKYTQ
jgi:hypothetical protein